VTRISHRTIEPVLQFGIKRGSLASAGLLLAFAVVSSGCPKAARPPSRPSVTKVCSGPERCRGRNPRVDDITILQQPGARPHWAPDGRQLLYDRRGRDGYADVLLTDLKGRTVNLTSGKRGIGQKNNGNAVFHPSGDYIVLVSEVSEHFGARNKIYGDPGLGLFSNLWAMNREGSKYWQLTDIPIRKHLFGKTPVMGVVNPHFSQDGSKLMWTERYDGKSGGWGKWRIKMASFVVADGRPRLENERTVVVPKKGNYVTGMGFLDPDRLLVAGNLSGQHEWGMDQYVYDLRTGDLRNLTSTPDYWEEGSAISPKSKRIVYMTNRDSRYELDRSNRNWSTQPMERDYWLMTRDGEDKERLTYFNEPSAPEFLGGRTIVAACEFSPDGRYLAGTLGIDHGTGKQRQMTLKVVLIRLKEAL